MKPHRDTGFTLAETLLATVLTMVVTGAVFTMVSPRTMLAHAQPESSDMQQRARVAADVLMRDLLAAGAGIDTGPDAGSLTSFLPPVIPRKLGLSSADADSVVRADAVTLIWAVAGFAQTTTSAVIAASAPTLLLAGGPPCGASSLCGMTAGSDVLAFDDLGHFDLFRITSIAGGLAELRRHATTGGFDYPAGARVMAALARTYYLDAVNRQLRVTDGYLSDTPVVDNVVGLTFSYLGDPNPPVHPRPESGANCLYDAAGTPAALSHLAPAGASLAPLPLGMLNDGPWCGETGNRFDADLLRVRQVRVTLRVQAGLPQFRGTGAMFAVPGTATRSDQMLPDVVISFDAAPRNLTPRGAPWSL